MFSFNIKNVIIFIKLNAQHLLESIVDQLYTLRQPHARWLPRMWKVARSILRQSKGCTDLHVLLKWRSGGTVLWRVEVMASQLDLPSLTPLSVAGCGWLQLGTTQWATSVTLLQVVDNWPHKIVIVDSPLEGSRLKNTLLFTYICIISIQR